MVKAGATASFSQHVPTWPPEAKDTPSAMDGLIASVIADQRAMELGAAAAAAADSDAGSAAAADEDARAGGKPKPNKASGGTAPNLPRPPAPDACSL